MLNIERHTTDRRKVYFFLISLVIISLYLPIKVNTYAITILGFAYFMDLVFIRKVLRLQRTFFLFAFFAFMHLLGMLYTQNIAQGLSEIERRSAVVVLPFIILGSGVVFREDDIKRLTVLFFKTGVVIGVALILIASARFLESGDYSVFFYQEFSGPFGPASLVFRLHPVYYSYFLLFGLFCTMLIKYEAEKKKVSFWLWNFALLILLVLLASKVAFGVFFVLIVVWLARKWRRLSVRESMMMVGGVMAVCLMVYLIPETRSRFSDILNLNFINDVNNQIYSYNHNFNGLSLRVVIWKLSIENLYRDQLLFSGVGTGDVKDYLNSIYARHGLLDGGYLNYNAHNEYVEMLLMLGIPGLLIFLTLIVWGTVWSIRNRNQCLTILLLILGFASLTESVLAINKGIMFFSLFGSLMLKRRESEHLCD